MIMNQTKSKLGNIFISYHAIATIAYQSALESYGVVGFANENFARGISRFFTKDPTSGVMIKYGDDETISIDLYVVIEYGTRISSVTNSIANAVKYKVENLTKIPVLKVNVHVRGLRVSNMD